MKIRYILALALTTILLASCNFTLAADVTPPPGYVPPTPAPTLGPLFPANAPDLQNGSVIYAVKCAPCHGATGLGDGPDGKQLPVTVAALGLPEVAHKAKPAQWFTVVSQGNIERFMPPFTSLSEQDRWDVVAYAFTLHTTPEQIKRGESLFEANCANCAEQFKNQEKMAALSPDELVNLIRTGAANIPAFGKNLSDDEAYAVAAYLRTLTFAAPVAQAAPTTAPVTQIPVSPEAGTPSAETTPVEGTPQAAEVTGEATGSVVVGIGTVTGHIDNQSGAPIPSDTTVILHGYDHGADPNAGPQEVLTLEGTVEADGNYKFDNVEIPESRIFVTEIKQNGISYQSDFVIVKANETEVTMPDVTLFATTTDLTNLIVENVGMHFNYSATDVIQLIMVYTMRNTGNQTIVVSLDKTKQDIPFIKAPANASDLGFQVTQDSAPFYGAEDGSTIAMPPTEQTYGLVVFTNLPAEKKFDFSQQFVLPVGSIKVLMPEGVIIAGDAFSDDGITPFQDENGQTVNFHAYSAGSLKAGETLTFTVSGKPKTLSGAANLLQNKNLLVIAGGLGLLLILAGGWMYMRDRNRVEEHLEEENDEFEDTESILDAIIALDDLHRAGKLSDEAYRKRREELKAKLKEES